VNVVVDTSAAVAVLLGEAAGDDVLVVLDAADGRLMSAATCVELGIVMGGRLQERGGFAVEGFLRDAEIEIVPLDRTQVSRALDGWRRFGRGNHAASLNLGDCFTYALAKEAGVPVLCVGDDFPQTDLEVLPSRA
jgi:ribonuclease VapC